MAQCPYFEDKGGFFSIEPYCKKICNSIPEAKYKNFCATYDYRECDYYKKY